jgi:hypothetical protein
MTLVPPENFAMLVHILPAHCVYPVHLLRCCILLTCILTLNPLASTYTLNVCRVAHGVYRSSYPTKKTLPFLKHIGVRSIVYLCLEEYTDGAKKFLEENDIRLFPHGTPGSTRRCPLPWKLVCASLPDHFRFQATKSRLTGWTRLLCTAPCRSMPVEWKIFPSISFAMKLSLKCFCKYLLSDAPRRDQSSRCGSL